MMRKLINSIAPFVGILIFGAALWVLHHELEKYHLADILRHVKGLPAGRLLAAASLTLINYLVMMEYDIMALRYIRHPLPFHRIAVASFVGYSFSNNIGFSMLAGSTVRYRLYSAWGLNVLEITKVIGFCTLTVWLGFFLLGGLISVAAPSPLPAALHLPAASTRPIGALFLFLVAVYLLLTSLHQRRLKLLGRQFPLPTAGLAVGQMVLSALDWSVAGAALYILLPGGSGIAFTGFLGIFIVSQFLGQLSMAPGGIGVFETVILLFLSPVIPAPEVLGALLVFRGIYYLLPLGIAVILLGVQEMIRKEALIRKFSRAFSRSNAFLVPYIFAFATFVAGAFLLFSSAAASIAGRPGRLAAFLPLPVIEISHLLGSMTGAALLVLAGSLERRINAAYNATVVLLGFGVLLSFLEGSPYGEAIVVSLLLAALAPCRAQFYRRASVLGQRPGPGWTAAIILVLGGAIWLGIFSYKHVPYSGEILGWFAPIADAPRFVRAMLGAVAVLLFFALARRIMPAPPEPALPGRDLYEKVLPIISESDRSDAHLALLGDKSFLFSAGDTAFIMYGEASNCRIGMGEPVGSEKDRPELLWRFCEMCDRHGRFPVFYEVGSASLDLYLDLGLTFLKLGEEARVPLESFSLEAAARKGLRRTCKKLERKGYVFERVPAQRVAAVLPECKSVSDAWLRQKNLREKGFSRGFFDPAYLVHFPCGTIRKNGRMLAFANLWQGADKTELSVDLVRYTPDAPPDTLVCLIVWLIQWGKQNGYRWFNFGMAPLPGWKHHELAPLWNRYGEFLFRYADHFPHLQEVRRFMKTFAPQWQAKYLVSPDGLSVPHVLADVVSLISGENPRDPS